MNPEAGGSGFAKVRDLFNQAIELPPGEQETFLRERCEGDERLLTDVMRLVLRDRHEEGVLSEAVLPELAGSLTSSVVSAMMGGSIGPYEIIGLLGDGGMGRVYRARKQMDGVEQHVAIKLIRPEMANPNILSRFSGERRMLASLDHPGICRFLDSGTLADQTPYVVMELVDGQALHAHCDAQRLPLAERVRLLRRICAAVEYAHSNLIVHRDIKASNVLIDIRGEPKLLDFGIAKRLAGSGQLVQTATADRFFTPGNAAPEQLRGEPVGVACDVYALGVLAYELLCGLPPFELGGLSAGEIERQLLDVPAPSMVQRVRKADPALALARDLPGVASLQRQLAGDLDAIVLTCLRKSPRERYASVAQLDEELGNFLARRPVRARGGNRLYRITKFVSRHAVAVGLSAALGVSLVLGFVIMFQQSLALEKQRAQALLERDRATQVADLLLESFTAADPSRVAGADVTIRQVLASARPRLDALESSQRDLFATLATTIAQVELNLGLEPQAAELAQRALVAAEEGEPSLRRPLLLLLGKARTQTGEFREAMSVLEAVRGLDGEHTKPDWAVAMASFHNRVSQYSEARELLLEALNLLAERTAEDELANTARWVLADSFAGSDDHQGALHTLDAALEWQRESLPEAHPRILLTGLLRAEQLSRSLRHAESIELSRQLSAQITQIYGDESPLTARAIAQIGRGLYRMGDVAEAVGEFKTAHEKWERLLGAYHPHAIRSMFNIAMALDYLDAEREEADSNFREALQRAVQRWGSTDNAATFMRLGYARFLIKHQNWLQAADVLLHSDAHAAFERASEANQATIRERLSQVQAGLGCVNPAGKPLSPACSNVTTLLDSFGK